jgi:mRNA interferase MazF
MRAIHLARMDTTRPALVLTRELVLPYLTRVTVAPITSTIKGLGSEVRVGPENGLETRSVVSCDNVTTILRADLGRPIGYLRPDQEDELRAALVYAFGLLGEDPTRRA